MRNIDFFTFSDQMPSKVLSRYNMILRDFIEQDIMDGFDADDYEFSEICNRFLEHMILYNAGFYFLILRPYIIKNH